MRCADFNILIGIVAVTWPGFVGADIITGLVAHYPFDGDARDASVNAQHGIVQNAVPTADRFGRANRAYKFDGSGDYICFTNTAVKNLQAHTIALWVRRDGPGYNFPRFFLNGSINYCITLTEYDSSGTGHDVFYRFETEYADLHAPNVLIDGKWQFIPATFDGAARVIYCDCVPMASNHAPFTIIPASGTYGYIGGDDTGSSFNGAIDDVRVYNRVLTASELQTLFSGQAPAVHITSAVSSVIYDVTSYAAAGTATAAVVGGMWVSNAANGEVHAFPAAQAWIAPPVALLAGFNLITVAGTNTAGTLQSDSVLINRQGLSSVAPFVDITNAQPAWLNYHITSFALAGTNNIHVHGGMWWSNTATAATGPVTRNDLHWYSLVTGLAEGTNIVHVCGSNFWNVISADTIMIRRYFEHDLPLLVQFTNITLREHQVLRRQVRGRPNVASVVCLPDAVNGAWFFDSNTWQFSCVPDFGTAGQVWQIPFIGINAFGMETQVMTVAIGAPAKGVGPKKPLLFEDEDGDLLDMKYSGVKKAGSVVLFDGCNLVISNAEPGGKLALKIKGNKKTGDGGFTLRQLAMDGGAKSVSLAGNVENIEMPDHAVQSLKLSSAGGYVSNVTLGAAGTISAGKSSIVGTLAVSNGFNKLTAQEVRGGRILAGVAAEADVTNTPARAGFGSVKVQLMAGSIIAGADTVENAKVTEPKISVTHASSSWFVHTKFDGTIEVKPIQSQK